MSDSNDIVTELRNRHANVTGIDPRITTPIVGQTIFSQAADEIELLRAEHDALRAERDEVRQSYCSLMEAYRGGDGRVTANKLGWGYLFEEDTNG